jgi:hypothetical protein
MIKTMEKWDWAMCDFVNSTGGLDDSLNPVLIEDKKNPISVNYFNFSPDNWPK